MLKFDLRKNISTHLFFNYFSVIFNISINVILLPVYLRFIDKDLYGYWLATGSLLGIIAIIDPGIADFVKQRTGQYYGENKFDYLMPFLKTSILVSSFFSVLFFIGGYLTKDILFDFINIENTGYLRILDMCFLITLASTSLMLVNYTLNAFTIGILSSLGQGLIFVVSSLLMVIATLYFLFNDHGLYSLVYGVLARAILVFILTSVYIYRRYKMGEWVSVIRFVSLKEVLPTILHSYSGRLGIMVLTNMESILITRYLGPAVNLNYSITRKVFDTLRLFFERTFMSFLPAITFLNATDNLKVFFEKYRDKFNLFIYLFIYAGFWAMLFNKFFISLWVGSSFYLGNNLNFLILVSVLFNLVSYCLSNFLFSIGEMFFVNRIILLQAISTFILSFIGLKTYDLEGYMILQIVSIMFISIHLMVRKFLSKQFTSKFSYKKIVVSLLLFFLLYNSSNYIEIPTYETLILYTTLYSFLFLGVILFIDHKLKNFILKYFKL